MSSNNTRIAKNTLMLYFRLIVVLLISLYTVRMVLNTLGVVDYGIYNVVSGVVTMFAFLSGSMAYSAQRFFSLELGHGDFEQLKRIFNLTFIIYIMIAITVVLLAETVGLWFVRNKLVIPPARINAAQWLYQFSIFSFVFTLFATPYTAVILAHEDMNIYAVLAIIKSILDLGIVILLQYVIWDKLKLYGFLLCLLSFIYTIICWIVCKIKYSECKFRLVWDKTNFFEIASYTGWAMFTAFSGIFKNQMINILLNQFLNPVVVTARSISISVNTAVSSFASNFNMALRPPIVKTYAAKQSKKMMNLVFLGTRATFFLMYLFIMPLFLEMSLILSLWLKNIPEYTIIFTRLTLIDALICSISLPVDTAVLATKKIGLYQFVIAGTKLFNLPTAWIALSLHAPVYSIMIIIIVVSFIILILRFVIIKRFIDFPSIDFFKMVIAPMSMVALLSAVLPLIVFCNMRQGYLRLCLVTGMSIISLCGSMYLIGITGMERKRLKKIIIDKLPGISKYFTRKK